MPIHSQFREQWERHPLLASLGAFALGGAGIGSMSNFLPLYIAPAGFFTAAIIVTYIWFDRLDSPGWRVPDFWVLSFVWAIAAAIGWKLLFVPLIDAEIIKEAKIAIATNTSQCADLGRKEGLERFGEERAIAFEAGLRLRRSNRG